MLRLNHIHIYEFYSFFIHKPYSAPEENLKKISCKLILMYLIKANQSWQNSSHCLCFLSSFLSFIIFISSFVLFLSFFLCLFLPCLPPSILFPPSFYSYLPVKHLFTNISSIIRTRIGISRKHPLLSHRNPRLDHTEAYLIICSFLLFFFL